VSLDNVQVHLVETTAEAAEFMRWVGERRPGNKIAFDTESEGLDKINHKARLAQFGDSQQGWAMSVDAWKGVIQEVFDTFDGDYITANGSFDWAMARNAGIRMPSTDRVHDIRPMHHPLDPTFSTGLKQLATRYVDPRAAHAQHTLDEAIKVYGWAGVPIDFQPYWCVPLDTEILTRTGWKKYSDVTSEDSTLGYENGRLEWTPVLFVQEFPDAPLVRFGNSYWHTECTPQHRWVMERKQGVGVYPLDTGWKDHNNTKLILSAPAVGGSSPLTVDEARVLAWVLSDGYTTWQRPETMTSPITHIIQHPDNFANDIRDLLKREGAYVSERVLESSGCLSFYVQATYYQRIWDKARLTHRSLSDLVLDLTVEARAAWFQVWYDAEGTKGKRVISQNIGPKMDALVLCAYLEGYVPWINARKDHPHQGMMRFSSRRPTPQKTKITDAGRGPVWCPVTSLGTWTARDRNGYVFVTGNTYAAQDTVLTNQLDDVLRPRMLKQCPKAYDLELATLWVTDAMERRGAHVDVEYAKDSLVRFNEYVDTTERWCRETYNVSPGSNNSVINALVAEGFDFTQRTATGQFKLDKDILEGIDHPLAATVLKRRQTQKLAQSYLRHFIEKSDADGIIHYSINSLGPRTGRMSITNPAFQTLPRFNNKNAAAIRIRNCIAARPGHTLLMCDFDQIEMRVLAYLSRDPGMLEAFTSGRDFFISMACRIYQVEDMDKSDPRRTLTKNTCYGLAYGAGLAKLIETSGAEPEAVRSFMQTFNGTFSSVPRFIKEVESEAYASRDRDGVASVYSPLTNRRHIGDRFKEYALVNYLIQGLAAELFKTKLLQIDASGLGQWMILPVHDEVILDVPHEHVPEAVTTLEKIMNDREMLAPIPLTASVSYGKRWGKKRGWKGVEEWIAFTAAPEEL
jgi:DNA polymerase I-like protein with 3'-5' exonuclease and polymerase domains